MLQIKNLQFSYSGFAPYVLNEINIEIPDGSYVSIIGENGSAKSTLVKLLLGLLKPCKGIVNINEDKIGYVPQRLESYNSQFPITVYELLKCHAKTLGLKGSSLISDVLNNFSMLSYKNNLIGSLSGGQQQKIILCRAVLGDPKLLILDEPSTGIDAQSQIEIYSQLSLLNRENKVTILSVEHNLSVALQYSTHILLLKNCKAELFSTDEYKKLYIS